MCSRKDLKDIFDTYASPYNASKDLAREKLPEIVHHGNRSVSQIEETSFIGVGGEAPLSISSMAFITASHFKHVQLSLYIVPPPLLFNIKNKN